jgi:hypothetical protein
MARQRGDDMSIFLTHPAFVGDVPHYFFEDDKSYEGDFPHVTMQVSSESLSLSCGYEIHSRFSNGLPDLRFRRYVQGLEFSPPWLKASQQPDVFEMLLQDNNLSGAWLSLNSIGWEFVEARKAIRRLAKRAGDTIFSSFAELWSSLDHEAIMGHAY